MIVKEVVLPKRDGGLTVGVQINQTFSDRASATLVENVPQLAKIMDAIPTLVEDPE